MNNKKYGLALWWGGARWFSYIWVMKILNEKWIEINEIAWTSAWAIVWALIALGLTTEEMRGKLYGNKMREVFAFWKHKWFIWTKKVKKKLISIFWDLCFEDCKIPLKIIATNVNTGKIHTFEKWSLVDAIMASISIPIVFEPYKIGDETFMDWCLLRNLPIDSLENDDVIAISTMIDNYSFDVKKELNRKVPIIWYGFLSQLIPVIANEENTLKYTKKNVIFLRPDVKEFAVFDFHKIDELMEIGQEEARIKLQNL